MSGPVTPPSTPPAVDPTVDTTSLGAAGFAKVQILDKLFSILVQLISTTQNVAASQAKRLEFYTAWQSAYTSKLNDIPTFIDGGNNVLGGASATTDSRSGFSKLRSDANNASSAYSTQIQGNRSTIQDDAKSLQSSVSQSDDAANSQADFATAIIQQFGTILSSLYSG